MALSIRDELPSIGYASGNFGKNLLWTAGEITLLFLLTEIFGIPPLVAGGLLLSSLVVDILINLTAGRLAAGARAKGVGYRARMLAAAGPCAFGFALLYALPLAGITGGVIVVSALFLFRIGYGFVDVPHNALLARVATDSRQRGRIAGYRSLFSGLAGLAVAGVLAPTVLGAATDGDMGLMAVWGCVAAILFVFSIRVSWVWTARLDHCDEEIDGEAKAARIPLLPQLRGDLLLLLFVALLTGFGMPMLTRNMLHLATYGFGDPAAATRLLTALTAGQMAGIAFLTWLIHRMEKRHALVSAHLGTAAAVASLAMVPTEARPLAAAIVGFALAGVYMLLWAIISDIVDADHLRDGERREAQSFAALLVAVKSGVAIGLLASGWALERAGIGQPSAEIAPTVIETLAFGPVIICGLLTAALIGRLKISHDAHALIQREL